MKGWRWLRQTQQWRDEAREHVGDSTVLRVSGVIAALYLFVTVALGIFWSREPALFSVATITAEQLPKVTQPQRGSTIAATQIKIISTLLDKPGGFIHNDIAPPGVWLDNMPAWEFGVLAQARDVARMLRESWGRENAEAAEDEALGRVEPRLNFSVDSWALPASEAQYREATEYLHDYLLRLQQSGDDRAHFVASAENLNAWLLLVSARLSDLSQRLSACVKPHDNPTAAIDDKLDRAVTPTMQIDNIFYEARGSAWALVHLLRAAEIDFAEPLQQNNATLALHQIIRDLEATQEPVYSPLILNGSGFGLLANHSLVMASYIARANASLLNLRNSIAKDPTQ